MGRRSSSQFLHRPQVRQSRARSAPPAPGWCITSCIAQYLGSQYLDRKSKLTLISKAEEAFIQLGRCHCQGALWFLDDHDRALLRMVMSEVACLVQSPHQANHANGETGIAGSALRRPRNREVTSRYKSPSTPSVVSPAAANRRYPTPNKDCSKNEPSTASPAPVSIRRFPTPNVDRSTHATDVPSPKRAVSVERRRPSPTRTAEHSSSKQPNDATTPVLPRRTSVRAELLWPSTRSLTSSMQLDSLPLPPTGQPKKQVENRGKCSNVSADQTLRPSANVVQKPAKSRRPTPERKATPLRYQNSDQAENARPQENLQKQHGRPGSSNVKISGAALGRSIDLSNDRERPPSKAAAILLQGKYANGSSSVSQNVGFSGAISMSVSEGRTVSSISLKPRPESRGRGRDSPSRSSRGPNSPLVSGKGPNKASPPSVTSQGAVDQVVNPARLIGQAVELASSDVPSIPDAASDSESVSSGGTTTTTSSSGRGTPGSVSVNRGVRGTTVPARFWQDAASRSKRLPENKLRSSMPESEFAAAALSRVGVRCKTVESPQGSHSVQSGSASSSPWSSTTPIRSGSSFLPPQQPLSPSKVSPYRNIPSPLRSRGGPSLNPGGQRSSSAALMLNFGADVRRGRKGLSLVEEIHLHRILHNRLLQWRFVNGRADGAMNEQTAGAEKMLYNVCVRIFDLRSSVIAKKIQLHQARQAQRLDALLSCQKSSLEDWSTLQGDHLNALEGAVRALEAAVLRVPVTGGVKADVPAVQDAISSAFDVMNLIENSAVYLLPKADKTNCLVSELGLVAAQERVLLEECASLLATASSLEVEERSIRTQLVQCEHERARVLGHLMDTTSSLPETAVV
ncbi:hypothetical protein GOP47_0006078 [Adiantum capillus-veneris]|uniref:AUGMIN subunit 8 n=1 Tax=Adiantum capillus-veneris TaxID=13818 RepID=A0A9D4V323_ADICA|nr:hypothetical protein GOP47_0006078 [Adiantum capillus-veneris]